MTKRPEVVLIAAVARTGAIGKENALPWRLKGDLAHFKKSTHGHPIVMGRKTWDSLGRPLPGRRNLVITRNPAFDATGAEVFGSPEEALQAVADIDKVFVIGGAELYRQMLDRADRLLLTEVQADVEGDAHFPPFGAHDFDETLREAHSADADNEFDYVFVEYTRRR